MRLPFARSLAVSLALSAMVLRALLPDGWMPSGGAGAGALPFIICQPDGSHHRETPGAPLHGHAHAPCAFAAAAPLSPPAQAVLAAPLPRRSAKLAVTPLLERAATAPPYRPNAARAPPAFA